MNTLDKALAVYNKLTLRYQMAFISALVFILIRKLLRKEIITEEQLADAVSESLLSF